MNICIVCGARPNFIKVAPVIRAIETAKAQGKSIDYKLVFSGAEGDPTLENGLFEDLQIRRPDVCLGVTCVNLNELTGQVMSAFEAYLQDNPTDTVIVVDDLASTMATAIVTKKQGLRLVHLAAGTRSFDIRMPKEINRLVIDGLSDILFTAGMSNNSIANREGAELSKVYMVGNVLIDNMRFNRNRLVRPVLFEELGLEEKRYIVFTLNRKALISNRENLQNMLEAIARNSQGMRIIAPLRGLAKDAVVECQGKMGREILTLVEPLPYLEFSYLTAQAAGVITDSGNVAEEATFNQVPCITLNSYTEHEETVKVGTNVLVGEDAEKLGEEFRKMELGQWKDAGLPDRWDGRSAERIVQTLLDLQ
ncbi:MAG: UDP-N-acetyl glucosamine 2-epimerase [Prevotella sp.]|nr:UDP-N-acetyl glucosamine 2-epimerase [Prevotella sp.]